MLFNIELFGIELRRPLSAAYKTVSYAADKGLRGRNVLQSVDSLILLRHYSRSIRLYIQVSCPPCLLHLLHRAQFT